MLLSTKMKVQPHIDHRYMLTFIPRHLNSAESTKKKKKKILTVRNFSFSFLIYLEGGREEIKKPEIHYCIDIVSVILRLTDDLCRL